MSERGTLALPADFKPLCTETPHEALVWFLKSGVSISTANHYGFGYSSNLARVVLPVYSGEELIAVQSRAIYKNQKPKYLNKTGGRRNPVFYSDQNLWNGSVSGLCIVEDILSAVRVGRVVPTLSTMGTHLSNKTAVQACMDTGGPIYIWYDPDIAGRRGTQKAVRTLELLGREVITIKSDKDPKEHNNTEITDILTSI